jgi:putative transposase
MRKCRIQKDGARYHISARINNKEMLLKSEKVKRLFEAVLVRAKANFVFQIENFVIMGNHYHLILKPPTFK